MVFFDRASSFVVTHHPILMHCSTDLGWYSETLESSVMQKIFQGIKNFLPQKETSAPNWHLQATPFNNQKSHEREIGKFAGHQTTRVMAHGWKLCPKPRTVNVLCFLMSWPVRCCHKRRQKRGSGGQGLLYSQVLGTGDVAHVRPPRNMGSPRNVGSPRTT